MDISLNSTLLAERRLRPALYVLIPLCLFLPYTFWISFILTFYLAASLYLERYRKRLKNELRVSFQQLDDILFTGEESSFSMVIHNPELLNQMMIKSYLRTPSSNQYVTKLTQSEDTITIFTTLPNKFSFSIVGRQRGKFNLDELALTITLPLRLGTLTLSLQPELQWVVYPAIELAHRQSIRHTLRLGERSSRNSPLKDRSRQISSKPYENEASRQIDWFATAKRGTLQSKVYQPVTQDTFTLVLDLSSPNGPGLHADFEKLIAQTALTSRELIGDGGKIELFINRMDESGHVTHLRILEGSKQLKKILYLLSLLSDRDSYINTKRFNTYVHRIKNKQSQIININKISAF